MNIKSLNKKANEIRIDIIDMVKSANSGHLGGSLSMVEILVALYYHVLNIDPNKHDWEDRDRFLLSKGHTAPALYAVLADKGYFAKELLFSSYRRVDSKLQGHPDINKTPGVDMTAGSLGIGLSAGCGIAYGARLLRKDFYTYVLLGDGECDEGQIWEAAMFASHYKLDNLIAFVDKNGMQNDGFTHEVLSMDNLKRRFISFGFFTQEVDGHDIQEIIYAINLAKEQKGKPSMIVCNTIKGRGVSYMENNIRFHGGRPTQQEYNIAMFELNKER